MKRRKYFVFDSFALMSFFQAEKGSETVKMILEEALKGDAFVHMSAINLGEIYYLATRKFGKKQAEEMLEDIKRLPIKIEEATFERIVEAGRIKARYPLSYADAFCISLAIELQASVVTGDPEFKNVESLIKIIWLGMAAKRQD